MGTKEKIGIAQLIHDFIQKNRKIILISFCLLLVIFIGSLITIFVMDKTRINAISELEELTTRYSELFLLIEDESATNEIDELITELKTFASKNSGFAKGKAWTTIAQIYSGRKDWPEAETAWVNAAQASAKSYLGPISFFNAAVAAEEQGKYIEAIDFLTKSINHNRTFPAAPRAQFAIGRLYETINDNSAAIAAYQQVLIKWSNIPIWTNLAQNRIIALEANL